MSIILPDIDICYRKIKKDCTVRSHKLAAIAFLKSGRILAVDTNRSLHTREAFKEFKWSMHAEDFLVRKLTRIKARERFGEIYMLVARWSDTNGWAMAKPCANCEKTLAKYGIAQAYYTDNIGNINTL